MGIIVYFLQFCGQMQNKEQLNGGDAHLPFSIQPPLCPLLSICSFIVSHPSTPHILRCMGFHWSVLNLPGTVEKTDSPSPSSHQLLIVIWWAVRLCVHLWSPFWNLSWTDLAWVLCMPSHLLWVQYVWMDGLLIQKTPCPKVMQHLWSLYSFCPLFCSNSLSLRGRGMTSKTHLELSFSDEG